MPQQRRSIATIALIVALGGFLMGFDASVISGVVGAIEAEFSLGKIELGWAVASLTLTASLAMLVAGPLSDRYGRRSVLRLAAVLFAASALASALAPDYLTLVLARMLGGLGVGAALIIAPMYIAELAPAERRGQLVSFNQLNIVIGISAAFFSNYLVLRWSQSPDWWFAAWQVAEPSWRVMLGIELLPAVAYFFALFFVPESPRWLVMRQRTDEARAVFTSVAGATVAEREMAEIVASLKTGTETLGAHLAGLWSPRMRLVLTVGLAIAVLQQITGINAVFFYAPMIFEQSGIGTDAAFAQAILVGLVNLAFTVVAILLIDRIGRRPLLIMGLLGISLSMAVLAWGFAAAVYTLTPAALTGLPAGIDSDALQPLIGVSFDSDVAFREALTMALGEAASQQYESALVAAAIVVRPALILGAILAFVASFAVSLGPVMWVLFSELFPNRLRGVAISVAGLVNSAVSFTVQLVFPWELEALGNATTFAIYGGFALIGLGFVWRMVPETKGRSLEDIERTFASDSVG